MLRRVFLLFKFFTMSKYWVVAVLLASLSGASWGQADRVRPERPHKARTDKTTPPADDPQQRRAAVRAALEAQRESKSSDSETNPRVRRQLSPQERQELRRQLRQQAG